MSADPADVVAVAERVADEVLLPAAPATDAADTLPRAGLDALADAGLYGLMGPPDAGGAGADLDTLCAVTEALAGGCLTTAFVWAQHVKTVVVAAASPTPAVRDMVPALCRGELRAGLALAGAQPGATPLRAARADAGWRLTGPVPWVSGWGRVDVLHTAALADDGAVVWSLVDARSGPGLQAARVPLAALDATATVDVTFADHPVADERVTVVVPPAPPDAEPGPDPATLRTHAALALGVARRCCRLLGPSTLDDEVRAARAACADAAGDIAAARADAAAVAVHAATALMSHTGSRSLRCDHHAQRLAREALFTSVFATTPPVRAAFADRLGVAPLPG